jgi:hypothetical protein
MSFVDTFETVERLVERIIAGEAVFFVGAGFSLDSEPNTSARLIRRLMARFAAVTEFLADAQAGSPTQSAASRSAVGMREGLRITFNLGDARLLSEDMVGDETVKRLAQAYYSINDWICSAFTILLRELGEVDESWWGPEIERREKILLKDSVPLGRFTVASALALQENAGKSLFLETMGFGDSAVWAGRPRVPNREVALESYGDRLRDRHHVIARLAREGLAPLILTTNFDLLLEGACRAAGFELGDAEHTAADKPPAAYDRLLVVAGPSDFFERGTAYRAALLLKIHGCVNRYRHERQSTPQLSQYLPSMVFTFREIQNWRKDSWSRDLVSTLLRTRSIVLCGYSGADPVVHDTFRTVYEEISAHRPLKVASDAGPNPVGGTDTRAFFTGEAGKAEFAGLEILRAGSRAGGFENPKLFGHKNYLPFHLLAAPGKAQPFPTMDELFVWIYHQTLRRMQSKAIRSDLARIAVTLLRRNVAPADVDGILQAFETQCHREETQAMGWHYDEPSRREFRQVTAWTYAFHVALLREFALLETATRNQRSGLRSQEFRRGNFYFALLDRPGWGAWGAVVEIALRRMVGLEDDRTDTVGPSIYPVALVRPRPAEFTKTALVLRGPGTHRIGRADVPGLYRRIHEWQLMAWVTGADPPHGTPSAESVWRWAFQPTAELRKQSTDAWFGESDESQDRRVSEAGLGPESSALRAAVATAPGSQI